jgi:hypothetical protein
MRASWIIAGIIVPVAIAIEVIGNERVVLWSYCQLWHATHQSQVNVAGLRVRIQRAWCPVRSSDGLSLTSVPAAKGDSPIMVRVAPLSDSLRECLPDLPESTEILGEKLRLIGKAFRHDLRDMSAFRAEYEREGSTATNESMIAWFFPDQGAMAFGFRIPPGKEEMVDELVAGFEAIR